MAVLNNFKKGAAELLLLHILREKGDCYGYQLSQLISVLSDGYLKFPEGSMYPALYKLIEKGYISDCKKLVGKRMTRVYYHIEPSGEERLAFLTDEFRKTNASIERILTHPFHRDDAEDKEEEG